MKQTEESKTSLTSMLAVIAVLIAALTVSFYISRLSSENQRYMLLNRQLEKELDKEREEKNAFAREAREMEKLLHNERSKIHVEEMSAELPYQQLYPELNVARAVQFTPVNPSVVYLTFNNGPFPMTESYLDLLKKHNVKATFFVFCGDDYASLERLKRIADEGHTLAPYTRPECNKLYPSAREFLYDFKRINDLIVEATGKKPDILRFPGGSVSIYNKTVRQQIIEEMQRRGYTYYGWNIVIAAADGRQGVGLTRENLLDELEKKQQKVIFMNDGSVDTLEALEPLIIKLKGQGYKFERLTNNVEPILLDDNPKRSQKLAKRQIS